MKIALACAAAGDGRVEENISAMLKMVENVSEQADLIVFGESALQGFECLCWNHSVDREVALSLDSTPITRLREAARAHNVAVSFGYIERDGDGLYSSQLVIGADGEVVHNFRRVSVGWKEPQANDNYKEGEHFSSFCLGGKSFSMGLCGDLWTDGCPEEIKALGADIVLWPVYCDYGADEWNQETKYEYAEQAALCGEHVLLVNPFCATRNDEKVRAAGGAAYFHGGKIKAELPAGGQGYLLVEL